MVLYPMKCSNCSFEDSFFHDMNEENVIEKCPKCGANMYKQLGLNSIVKCDGFYSVKNTYSDAKKVRQQVMAVDERKINEIDEKVKKNAYKGKLISKDGQRL